MTTQASLEQLSQKLRNDIDEAKLPTDVQKTIEIATKHREEIKQKLQDTNLTEDEKQLYVNADSELAAIIAENENAHGKLQAKTQAELSGTKQDVASAKTAPTASEATLREDLAEYQKESEKAIREILFKDNKVNEANIKQAMRLADELSQMKITDEAKFKELDSSERDVLRQQIPAVRGMIGSLFVESLFANGYDFRFDGSGKLVVGHLRGEETHLLPNQDMELIMNSYIGQSPSFAEMIKAGMLFHGGDLSQYVSKVSDADGKNISEQNQRYESFTSYLRNRPNQAQTKSGNAIMNSKQLFSDSEFKQYMQSVKYVPQIQSGIEAIAQNPNTTINLAAPAAGVAAGTAT